MKRAISVVAAACAMTLIASPVISAPKKLSSGEMDQVVAGDQQHFPPGQFPAGNPAKAPGSSNNPSGK
jgi:hypothetical protein